jgi:tRNA dimethylallyltransferase
MTSADAVPDILVIAGPTASGKSRLARELAESLAGEIVSADAFAVYRGMDIGTDKPDPETRRRVRHHLVDVADPDERFSAGDFVRLATAAIADIRRRGAVPIVAGGTHFYIRALLFGLFRSPAHDPSVRMALEQAWDDDQAAVVAELAAADPRAAARIGPSDRQRILRALEIYRLTGVPISEHWSRHRDRPSYHPLMVAPRRPRAELYARIDRRVEHMFSSGLEEEVQRILALGNPPTSHALKAIGYRQVVEYLAGRLDRRAAIESTQQASRNLAKRQLTWLRARREGALHWVAPAEQGGTETVARRWLAHTREGGTK